MLYLYQLGLKRYANPGDAHGFLVCAPSEAGARTLAASQAGREGHAAWLDAEQSWCLDIGEPRPEETPSVMLRAYLSE